MPSVGDLHAQLCLECDDDVQFSDALVWFNRCSNDLSGVLKLFTEASTNYEGGTELTIPGDLAILREVRFNGEVLHDLDKYPFQTSGYRVAGNLLVFTPELSSGVITVTYYRLPGELTSTESTPEIPRQFHWLYVKFAAREYFLNWNIGKASIVGRQYEQGKAELARYVHYVSNGLPCMTRDVMPTWRNRRMPVTSWVVDLDAET